MKKLFLIAFILGFYLLPWFCKVYAQQAKVSPAARVKQGARGDRQEIKKQKQEIKTEEHVMQQKMQDAIKAGDYKSAQEIREGIRALREEGIEEKKGDNKEVRQKRQGLKSGVRESGKKRPAESSAPARDKSKK